ncbi:hypothetical protein [Microbacterium sp. 4-7]|uniref:hypothetical protein n=1 Tax=Microbacterium sp. 4-7 TaxID=1885327 RepID=UPI00164FCE51|nr:hypothetical protein [Microbacterium sp. 4-7]MBC6493553.1 hypothetical protein [Microbacterium sp. 4-7]
MLSSFSDDFGSDAKFHADIEARLIGDTSQQLVIDYNIVQSVAWMDECFLDGTAHLVMDVQCRSTLYREYLELDGWTGQLVFENGQLYGSTTVTPLIIASASSATYRPDGIDDEFGASVFNVQKGDILGIGDSVTIDLEFSRTLERDLVTIQYSSEDSDVDIYRFQYDSPRIIIIAGESLRDVIGHMRADRSTRPYLFMSIYKDCIAGALNYLAHEEDGENTELAWGRALLSRLDDLGRVLDPEDAEYQEISAQLLVSAKGFKKIEVSDV